VVFFSLLFFVRDGDKVGESWLWGVFGVGWRWRWRWSIGDLLGRVLRWGELEKERYSIANVEA